MAFNLANLNPIGGQSKRTETIATDMGRGGPQMWAYITQDALATVDGAGYFNAAVAYAGAYHLLEIGDFIFVTVLSGATYSAAGIAVVNGKASGTVDVTSFTALGTVDSD